MTQPDPQYNYIYSKLVTKPNDIVGIIAYARYKQQKIEWISNYHAANGGAEPSNADLAPFNAITNTDTALQGYRLQAKEILDGFLSTSTEQAAQEIDESYQELLKAELRNVDERLASATRPVLNELKNAVNSEIKAGKPSFMHGVWQNVLANFIILVITAVILLVIWSLKFGIAQVIGEVLGYEVKAVQTPVDKSPK